MNYDTGNLSNTACTFNLMDKWAALESCSTKIFNENLFIKSGDVVSFDLQIVELHAIVSLKASEVKEI